MESEREKKEKLASARKKLNEYKLSRSGNSSSATGASSQPADVPLFYQNINSPPSAFNIFNPTPGNNNFGASPSFFDSVLPPAVAPTSTSAIDNNTFSGSLFQPQNDNFQLNQLGNPIQQNDFSPYSPFSSPSPEKHNEEKVSRALFPDNIGDLTISSSQASPTPQLFTLQQEVSQQPEPDIDRFTDSADTQQDYNPVPLFNVEEKEKNSAFEEAVQNFIQDSKNESVDTPVGVEYSPSAPVWDIANSDKNVEQLLLGSTNSATAPSEENTSSLIYESHVPESESIDNSVVFPRGIFPQETQQSVSDAHETPVPVFASSLFNPAANEFDKLGSIFNYGGNSENIQGQSNVPFFLENPEIQENVPEQNTFATITTPDLSFGMNAGMNQNVSDVDSGNEGLQISFQPLNVQDEFQPETAVENNFQHQHVFNDVDSSFSYLMHPSSSNVSSENSKPTENVAASEGNDENVSTSNEVVQQMRSVQEALELQIEELRKENSYLLGRQTELTLRIEESEKLAHEFKLEKDRVREEAATTSQALRARINSLCEENQRIVKNSTDIGVDLRAKLGETSKQLEEMQKAVIIVSQSKMDFAGKLDNELERVKELQAVLKQKDEEIATLKADKSDLQEKLKQDHQREAIIHQLQDQSRHYQVQCETLQRELGYLREKLKNPQDSIPTSESTSLQPLSTSVQINGNNDSSVQPASNENDKSLQGDSNGLSESGHQHTGECKGAHGSHEEHHPCGTDDHSHHHEEENVKTHHHDHNDCGGHDHSHNDQHHHHAHDTQKDHHHNDHHHDHDHHHHVRDDHHHHDHDAKTDHQHHHHDDDHHLPDSDGQVVARRGPSDEITDLKKTLHRLEWENSTFKNEINILVVDAKQKRTYEDKCTALEEENLRLKKEVEQLEHVIIQLQGENDTIGDYITLYQTQKMALKECAKEKDAHLEQLSREREMLLHRLAELTALVKDLKDSKSEAGSQCADDHVHTCDSTISPPSGNKRQIEGKIRDLLTEISSSSLIENFHPCAVCSGRLMTV